jgi:hypothetical protein
MIEDKCADDEIPLLNITIKTLAKVLEFAKSMLRLWVLWINLGRMILRLGMRVLSRWIRQPFSI